MIEAVVVIAAVVVLAQIIDEDASFLGIKKKAGSVNTVPYAG